ncbi:fizzy-related protein homolog [Danaus plexippus]|uniref:Fizzy-related protein homolog n=1 Tax=Danaus plexippus plexippus TaxID=278856 RepID=A0A212EMH9_DANPL|nr:fizzy-related protein homolog [Danaus plexippus plexippus]XP_061383060.1 fizzy-related protein homolog [Danaus plexippus]OWR42679.1 Fizzy-related protein [Danaus plexippus plexippus]
MFSGSYERRLLQQCSPVSRRQSVFVRPEPMDRFIPCRLENNWRTSFQAILCGNENQPAKKPRSDGSNDGAGGGRDHLAYDCLLRNELLDADIEELRTPPTNYADGNKSALGSLQVSPATKCKPVFRFRAPVHSAEENIDPSPYSLSPVSAKSQKLLRSPRKATRKISRIPFKVLDAPELQDDFYLNLVDWSIQNVLSVGLGSCVYLWSACTSQVTRLCDLSSEGNAVTSVAWSERGHLVAVGTQKGHISVWDVAVNKEVTKLQGHIARVGALAWNGDVLSSGSRDRHIRQRDTRTPPVQAARVLQGHRQEVCGLKWSPDGQSLASGGNDNKLFVWSMHSTSPVQTYSSHVAAVKAIAWSPHQHGLLASGGGTADRCIRFWNTLTTQPMQCVDTGSQVCNLAWSKHSSELVSTHGYSQNQILVWKYPSLTQVAKLTGHSYRVLYLALSPDGEAIVTGAGDETLRFWNVFSKIPSHKENKSVLNLYTALR